MFSHSPHCAAGGGGGGGGRGSHGRGVMVTRMRAYRRYRQTHNECVMSQIEGRTRTHARTHARTRTHMERVGGQRHVAVRTRRELLLRLCLLRLPAHGRAHRAETMSMDVTVGFRVDGKGESENRSRTEDEEDYEEKEDVERTRRKMQGAMISLAHTLHGPSLART